MRRPVAGAELGFGGGAPLLLLLGSLLLAVAGWNGDARAVETPAPNPAASLRLDEAVRAGWFAEVFPRTRAWKTAPGVDDAGGVKSRSRAAGLPGLESPAEETVLQGVWRREGRETHIRETIRVRRAVLDAETGAPLAFPEGDRPRREAIVLSVQTVESSTSLFAAPLLRSEAVELVLDAGAPATVLRFGGVRIVPGGGEWLECDRTVPTALFRWSSLERGANSALLGLDDEGAMHEEAIGVLGRSVDWLGGGAAGAGAGAGAEAGGAAPPLPELSCRVYEPFAGWDGAGGAPARRLGRVLISRKAGPTVTLQTSDGAVQDWNYDATPPYRLSSRVRADGVLLRRTGWRLLAGGAEIAGGP